MKSTLGLLLLVHASISTALITFYAFVSACERFGISPFWAGLPYFAGTILIYRWFCCEGLSKPRKERWLP